MKVFFATCDQFDNHQTGYHATAEEAEAAFWDENTFSDRERQRVQVYTRAEEVDDSLLVSAWLAQEAGSPSPALSGMKANVELDQDDNQTSVIYRVPGSENWGVLTRGLTGFAVENILHDGLVIR